jgi:hypothetical protein
VHVAQISERATDVSEWKPQRGGLGHRPIPDQHRVAAATSGITSDPNNPDEEEYIVRLVGQVVRVSIETVKLVNALPAEYSPPTA